MEDRQQLLVEGSEMAALLGRQFRSGQCQMGALIDQPDIGVDRQSGQHRGGGCLIGERRALRERLRYATRRHAPGLRDGQPEPPDRADQPEAEALALLPRQLVTEVCPADGWRHNDRERADEQRRGMYLTVRANTDEREIDAQMMAFEAHRPGPVPGLAEHGDGVILELAPAPSEARGLLDPVLFAGVEAADGNRAGL